MTDMENVIKGLELCTNISPDGCLMLCPYKDEKDETYSGFCEQVLKQDALALLKEQDKEIKALRLLVEWAEECDFGFDQFPDEYERYKDEIKDMQYIDGMIYVAKRTLEDHGVFDGGR